MTSVIDGLLPLSGPGLGLVLVFYAFLLVWLPGMGALLSATLLARRNWIEVTLISLAAAIPFVGYELLTGAIDSTIKFFGALLVGAYLGCAVALIVRGGRDDDYRLVGGGATLWAALLVGTGYLGGAIGLETAVVLAGLWAGVLVVAGLSLQYAEDW